MINAYERPADVEILIAEVTKISDDLQVFDAKTANGEGKQDFSQQTLPMQLFSPPKDVRLPEAEMRKLYDELTTDPAASEASIAAMSEQKRGVSYNTKVPFGQLRYDSWKLITYLLAEADAHDKAYVNAVDIAIANSQPPPERTFGKLFDGNEPIIPVGLSDPVHEVSVSEEKVDVEKVRARICELRQVTLPQKVENEQ